MGFKGTFQHGCALLLASTASVPGNRRHRVANQLCARYLQLQLVTHARSLAPALAKETTPVNHLHREECSGGGKYQGKVKEMEGNRIPPPTSLTTPVPFLAEASQGSGSIQLHHEKLTADG